MRREEIDYVSSNTIYRTSFLIALGYELEKIATSRKDQDELFYVMMDGKKMSFEKKKQNGSTVSVSQIRRGDFFKFAEQRHASLRKMKAERKIEYPID